MMPLVAIACACRVATAVNLASIFTAGSPCSRRYCDISAMMSSAPAEETAVIIASTNESRKQVSFICGSQPVSLPRRQDLPLRRRDGNRCVGRISHGAIRGVLSECGGSGRTRRNRRSTDAASRGLSGDLDRDGTAQHYRDGRDKPWDKPGRDQAETATSFARITNSPLTG